MKNKSIFLLLLGLVLCASSPLFGDCNQNLEQLGSKSRCTNAPTEGKTEIIEYKLNWPKGVPGTHDLISDPDNKHIWVSGPTHDAIARVRLNGKAKFFPMPEDSFPHGLGFDTQSRLWVTLENLGFIVRVNNHGKIVEWIDVHLKNGANSGPHAIAFSRDGRELWFVGKNTSTVGKITLSSHKVKQYFLTPNSAPIYISLGSDNNMWCTEYLGNQIARVSPCGEIAEFKLPDNLSQPVAIIAPPNQKGMWFSSEIGHSVANITFDGKITEYDVPQSHVNSGLLDLEFDCHDNLWTLSTIREGDPFFGDDYLVKIDRRILKAKGGDISKVPYTFYKVPSRNTLLHRIIQGPNGNMWFTELATDVLGTLIFLD